MNQVGGPMIPVVGSSTDSTVRVLLKNGLFTILAPGTVAVAVPRWLARRDQLQLTLRPSLGRLAGGASVVSGVIPNLHTARRFADEGVGPRHRPTSR